VNKVGQNPLDKIDSAGFSARGTLKRSDFGMKTYLGAIGDDIDLIIEIEAKKKWCHTTLLTYRDDGHVAMKRLAIPSATLPGTGALL
jgi:YceI-like domain